MTSSVSITPHGTEFDQYIKKYHLDKTPHGTIPGQFPSGLDEPRNLQTLLGTWDLIRVHGISL